MTAPALSSFDKRLVEIAFMGAFYGLAPQAQTIFAAFANHAGAKLGEGFACLFAGQADKAAALFEAMDANPDYAAPEAKLLLALAYKQLQSRSDRVETLIREMEAAGGAAADAARQLAAG